MAEADALAGSPAFWHIRLSHVTIRMAVPLFSYARYTHYNLFANLLMIKQREAPVVPLSIWVDRAISEGDEEAKEIKLGLMNALDHFKAEYGVAPRELCDFLSLLSDPADMDQFWAGVDIWSVQHGLMFRQPEVHDIDLVRNIIRTILEHEIPVSDLVQLLFDLAKINSEVKKKFISPQEHHSENDPSLKLWSTLAKIRSGEIRPKS